MKEANSTVVEDIGSIIAFVLVVVIFVAIVVGIFNTFLWPIIKRSDDAREAARVKCESHVGYRYVASRDFNPICVKVLEE